MQKICKYTILWLYAKFKAVINSKLIIEKNSNDSKKKNSEHYIKAKFYKEIRFKVCLSHPI